MANDLPPEAKRVVTYAERVSATLALGGTVCTAAILGRAFGHDTIKVQSFDIPLGYIAAVIGIGTVAHVFWSFFILKDLVKFQKLLQIKEGEIPPSESESRVSTQTLFDEIRTHKGLFLLGLVPRTFRDGSSIAKMSLSDPTTWLSYGIALLTIIAILPWRVDHGLHWASPEMIIAYTGIALILVVINWWAGGLWIISLSRLTEDPTTNLEQLELARHRTDSLAKVGGFAVSVLNILFWPAIIFGIVVGAVYLFHGKLAWWVIIVATISIIFIILLLLVVLIAMTGGSSIGPDDEYDEPSPPTEAEDQA